MHDNGLVSNHVLDYDFDPDHVDALNNRDEEHSAVNIPSENSDVDIEDPISEEEIERTSTTTDGSACDPSETLDPINDTSLLVLDDPSSTLNPLTRFLFKFATKYCLSDKAMSSLMQGLTSIDCTRDYYVPKDFRTVHNAISRSVNSSNLLCDDFDDDELLASAASGVSIMFICSKCNTHEFNFADIKSQKPCRDCGVVTVRCGFQRCKCDCVATSLLGNRSLYQLTECFTCKAGPTSQHTVRLYFFNLENNVRNFFKNENACLNAMAPFAVDNEGGNPLFVFLEKSRKVVVTDNWYELWKSHIESLSYKSDSWHGERFYKHPIWEEHGMRSLLLSMFIDWFPPFKKKGYSLGIVSCAVMNVSSEARCSSFSVWPMAVLEGPSQMHSTYVGLRKLCQTFESFYNNGIRVHDALTNSFQVIHGVVAQVIGDSPALAKIGSHNSHSSYFGCHRCGHKGVVCGCDTDRPAPSRFDNIGFHPQTMKELDRITLSGNHRKSSNTEHIVWLEAELITKDNLRSDRSIKADEFKIWSKLHDTKTRSWSNHRMTQWMAKLRVKGLSPLVHIPHLSLVNDLPTESMHFLIKGILLQLAEYTFSERKQFKSLPSNVNRSPSLVNSFLQRMQRFTLPQGVDAQHGLSTHVHFAKAQPLYSFLKVQALLSLEGLVSPRTFEIWRLMSVVVCAILHTHNPKWWFEQELSIAVRDLVNTFMAEFGECAMRPSWHYLLHCKMDYENWSTARSHWAFPGERLCGLLLRQVRNASFSRITQSIVRMSHRAMISLQLDDENADHVLHCPARKLVNSPLLPENLNSQMQVFLSKGYSIIEKGMGYHHSVWKVGDYAWYCDYDRNDAPSLRLFKVVAILRLIRNEGEKTRGDVLVLQRLDQIAPRTGYHNVFKWAPLDPLQANGVLVDTSKPKPSVHMCGIALYATFDAGNVLVPVCGNLPF